MYVNVSVLNIMLYIDVCKEKPPAQKIKSVTRNYKTVDMPSFVNNLQVQLSQPEINNTTMTNYSCDSFEQIQQNVLDKHAPATTRVRAVRPLSPWYNDEIKEARRIRRRLERM